MTDVTIGRVVYFEPATADLHTVPDGKPYAAIVADVAGDKYETRVSLTVFGRDGKPYPREQVRFYQDHEKPLPGGRYAYWMPYQVKTHARKEAEAIIVPGTLMTQSGTSNEDLATLIRQLTVEVQGMHSKVVSLTPPPTPLGTLFSEPFTTTEPTV